MQNWINLDKIVRGNLVCTHVHVLVLGGFLGVEGELPVFISLIPGGTDRRSCHGIEEELWQVAGALGSA